MAKPKARPTYRGGNNSGGSGNSGDSGGGSRYEPFPATDLRDRFGRPVYKDRFGTYKDARGFPINPWNIKDEVRDRYGRSICDDFFNRPMFGCR